jgi:imidazolonepropionase-like amidohydrolase
MQHGLPMASGNDGGAPLVGVGDMAAEVELLEEVGLHPRDALAMATVGTARLFGLSDIGLVEPGHAADLMAVRGDPMIGAAALRDPALVIARGEIVRGLDR